MTLNQTQKKALSGAAMLLTGAGLIKAAIPKEGINILPIKEEIGIIDSIKTQFDSIINGNGTDLGKIITERTQNNGVDLSLIGGATGRTVLGVAATTFGGGYLARNYLKEFGVKSELWKNIGTAGAMGGTIFLGSSAGIAILGGTAGLLAIKGAKWVYRNKNNLLAKNDIKSTVSEVQNNTNPTLKVA